MRNALIMAFIVSLLFTNVTFGENIEASLKGTGDSFDNKVHIKCGTPQILRNIFLGTFKITARPVMDVSVLSSQNNFRVHYNISGINAPDLTDDNENGIPDYVDSTLVFFEYAWDLMVNQLGYLPPLSDEGIGGGDEIDVYLKDMGNVYGVTYPVNVSISSYSAYIEIDKDYSDYGFSTHGYDALRVTTAHEFFHTIQFRYFYNFDLVWWMEQTAVWIEDIAWDDVNDYLTYLYLFFNNFLPLDYTGESFMYGAAIWAHYLSKRFGIDIIKDLWVHLSYYQTSNIASFEKVIPIGLSNAFAEFSVWNYFTKNRANTSDFYSDSDLFNESVNIDLSIDIYTLISAIDTLETKKLTSRYVEISFEGEQVKNNVLLVHATPLDGGTYVNSLILYNNPFDFRIDIVNPESELVLLEKNWGKAILVTSCTNTTDDLFLSELELMLTTNTPPVITTTELSDATEGIAYYETVDVENPDKYDKITFELLVGSPDWLIIEADSGVLSGIPGNNDVKNDVEVIIKATDSLGISDQKTYMINVINVNDPPEIMTTGLTNATEGIIYSDTLEVEDPDVGDYYICSIEGPTWLTIEENTGILSGTPENDDVGSDIQILIQVTDSYGISDTLSTIINVINVNDPLEIITQTLPDGTQDVEYSVTLEIFDIDENDSYTCVFIEAPEWLEITDAGVLSGIPINESVGDDIPIAIIAEDTGGLSDTLSTTINILNVLDPPLNFTVEDIPDDHGHRLQLKWDLSPDEEYYNVSWYRIVFVNIKNFKCN